MAMERALAAGDRVYDLLAGDHRYKRSLARGSTTMVWAEVVPAGSMAGLAARLTQHARRLLSRI
jgi:CelD/BcsL family acetyltransferase involved in cellulose biosynthesis